VSLDGNDVSSMAEMVSHLNTLRPGDHVTVKILRDLETRDVDVTLAEWPDL
jgi:S1-C subfamily serine protease